MHRRDLSRLLRPKTIALFGGKWAANVVEQLRKSGYTGEIWPVHPKRRDILGMPCFSSIELLPAAPDACFVGVNRQATVELVRALCAMGAGGATCFASGFLESETEEPGGAALQAKLVEAAGEMPLLGPNCYGFLNYLDNVKLWPDQHGGRDVRNGVAIVAQSSNIAINMTMQSRGLPIACVIAAGNQAQTGIAEIATHLLADDRVTAIGLHVEGLGDVRALETFAQLAARAGKPVTVLKTGKSKKAQAATLTHTASLAGGVATSSALIRRLGFAETPNVAVFLETLKLLHCLGKLPGNRVCSVSCSGGEAALMADLGESAGIDYRSFSTSASGDLKSLLGPFVSISNPLDYHTYVWGDTKRMTDIFAVAMGDGHDLTVFVLDLPRPDRCEQSGYRCAVDAIIAARALTGARVAVLATLPENLREEESERFHLAGIATLHGMQEGIEAVAACAGSGKPAATRLLLAGMTADGSIATLTEAEAKTQLSAFGLAVPRSVVGKTPAEIVQEAAVLNFPVALKSLGLAHKSENRGVVLGVSDIAELGREARAMSPVADGFLAEEMVTDAVAELLVGVVRDPTGLFLLTIGAGGILTEIHRDTASLLLPASRNDIRKALGSLRIGPVLSGYRGMKGANIDMVLDAIEAIVAYVDANAETLVELDVNPVICGREETVAVDALVRHAGTPKPGGRLP